MSFIDAVKSCFRKYISISGRAPRSEYWWFTLFLLLLGLVAMLLDTALFNSPAFDETGPIENLANLATFIPSITVAVRRLHDINKSGFYIFMPLVGIAVGFFAAFSLTSSAGVIIGFIIGLVAILWFLWWMIKPSDPDPNRFGPNPFNENERLEEVFE